ncbi:MMPL family transporter [Paenibacillus montanisoli]|uniref:MMPL family transporter n=1 Tax=Paenibacillus montanisoli TaxID=2081970 RepID=A0A328TY32_9BACL|nr:MMPL family transporter [Paenibacillus montanisoli]RAP75397.1 MMPL family transporter [Paenibacillus montanisoli]
MTESRLEKLARMTIGRRGRWMTLAVWLIAAALLNIGLPKASDLKDDTLANFDASKPSVQAERLIAEQFPSGDGIPALMTWHRSSGLTDEDLAGIQKLAKRLAASPVPHQIAIVPHDKLPLPALKQQVSADGTTFVQPVLFEKNAGSDGFKAGLERLEQEAMPIFKEANPFGTKLEDGGLAVRASGPVGIAVDATGLFESADVSLLMATVLLVLLFLLLIYRSPVLALIPLVAVGFAYGAITPLLGWMADLGWIEFDSQSLSIMTVLLFGAGTDYCLFLIARFRSELKEEASTYTSLKRAFSGSSGAIAMSGLTVVISLLVLLAAEFGSIRRFAIPFSLAIFIMMLASLTLVPALLALLGRASFYPFVPKTREMALAHAKKKNKPAQAPRTKATLGDRLGESVVRWPKTIAFVTTAILLLCVVFATQIKYTFDTLSSFPADTPSREGFALIADRFNAGGLAPVQVIVRSQSEEQTESVRSTLASLPFVKSVAEPVKGATMTDLLRFEVELSVNPYSNEAIGHIPDLRQAAEDALEQPDKADETRVWIGGQTAEQYDTQQTTGKDARLLIPAIIILIALLLLAYLRSVVAMLYLIATVLLSYFSALGLGWIVLHDMFGTDAIQGLIPLYSFVFIVALGEDYNIFMIASIWKKARNMPLRRAVKEGVSQTGSVITSAGLILAGTFAVLATLPIQVLVQFGTVTAIGVLLDTFIVRPFLVPALTVLCGRAAFWPAAASKQERAAAQHR